MANKKQRKRPAKQPWEGSEWTTIPILVPAPMRMLAGLLELELSDVLHQFIEDLFNSRNKERWTMVRDYFLVSRQGQQFYTSADIRQMIEELTSIEVLWPSNADMPVIDAHARWRDMYQKYWYHKWYHQIRRKAELKN